MPFKKIWSLMKDTFTEFSGKKVPKLSAALAYYTIFSLPAVLIIVLRLVTFFYGAKGVESNIFSQIGGFIGHDAATQIQEAIRNTSQSTGGGISAIIGIITLILGASGVFGEIQDSINQVWHLKAKPRKGRGFIKMIINRLLSFSMVIVLGFLLLVSLIINGLMDALMNRLSSAIPQAVILYIINTIVTLIITTVLFGALFKVLPDARIKWKEVRFGAFITALLFTVGRFLISLYLAHNNVATTYGTAGSVIIILLWVYYSATILYLGAVFTRVYSVSKGLKIYPNDYAVWVEQQEVESKKPMNKSEIAKKPAK
jgi:membrane protein